MSHRQTEEIEVCERRWHSVRVVPPGSTSAIAARRLSRRQIAFRVGGVCFPWILLVVANLWLYLADAGVNTQFILPAPRAAHGRHYLNPLADFPYTQCDLRGPEPRAFDLPKPKGNFRIVVVGESSVQGYPYPSELAFPRQLELVVARQFPEKQVEVLNAGIVAISSAVLVEVVEQVLSLEPDVVVVYAGHNEFYGVGGVASNAPVAAWRVELMRFRLAQALARKSTAPGARGDLISTLPRQLHIEAASPLIREAEETFARNMARIVELAGRRHVPLLVCGVASNLRDQSPRLPEASTGRHASDRSVGSDRPFRADDAAAGRLSRTTLEDACRLDPENAVLHYRLAQACEAAGDRDAALGAYIRARDLDVCRYRAPTSFREILQRVCDEHSSPTLRFIDVGRAFEAETRLAAPGSDLFLEHVHFSFDGHWLLARLLGRSIIENFAGREWRDGAVPSPEERDEWLDVIPEDHVTAHALAWFVTKEVPFDRAADAQQHHARLGKRLQELLEALPADHARRLAVLPHQTKVDDLVDGLGRAYLEERRAETALRMFELGRRRRPWLPNSAVFAAACLQQLGRFDEARQALEEADRACLPPQPALTKVRKHVESRLRIGRQETGI
jgi:lysophospholipase L1-like esterase